MSDPIDNIQWKNVDELNPNGWNPNVVFNQELKLLERSILFNGWVHPILVNANNIIIDGFHRWRLSKDSQRIKDKYNGMIPCAVLDIPDDEAILMTIRINRAKGTHVAIKMADIVQSLIDDFGLDEQEIAQAIGATRQEVELLYRNDIFKERNLNDYKYSKAWVPKVVKTFKNKKGPKKSRYNRKR